MVYCAADVYSKGLFDSFSKACEEYGIEVAASQSTASLDVQDYTNQFAAMVSAGVDFVYAPYYYDVIGPYVVPQARAAGYTGIIMGADGYDTTPDYVVAGADLTVFNDVQPMRRPTALSRARLAQRAMIACISIRRRWRQPVLRTPGMCVMCWQIPQRSMNA